MSVPVAMVTPLKVWLEVSPQIFKEPKVGPEAVVISWIVLRVVPPDNWRLEVL